MVETLILMVTSEKTWSTLDRYGFNEHFLARRGDFHLALAFNGHDEAGLAYVQEHKPEMFYPRPNTGYETAGLDYLLKRIPPTYKYYGILHDDHWFPDAGWLDRLTGQLEADPGLDGVGNLVRADAHLPPSWDAVTETLGYGEYRPTDHPFFLQGMAGLFRRSVFATLHELDGIPHVHRNQKEAAQICERLFTFMLLARGHRFSQIPPGYERYLKHRDW